MKILFNTYSAAMQTPGGGEIVLMKLKEHLERFPDIQIDLFDMWKHKFSDYDLIHEFTTFNWELWYHYRTLKIPLVVTPTMFPVNSIWAKAKIMASYNIKRIAQHRWQPYCQRSALSIPDLYLPTTKLEWDRILYAHGPLTSKHQVLANGVDDLEFTSSLTPTLPFTDYVLFVGNISPVKRLDALITSCSLLQLPLVIVGGPHPEHNLYAKKCQMNSNDKTIFIGPLPTGSPQLVGLIKHARVVAISSSFETCSLVGLEAGVLGRPLVMTKRGGTTEIFGPHAHYHDPQQPHELGLAIKKAWEMNGNAMALRQHIRENYLWESIAAKVHKYYRDVLSGR